MIAALVSISISVSIAIGVAAPFLATQGARAAAQRFDVASIKPCPGDAPPEGGRGIGVKDRQLSPGSAHWNCVTIDGVIASAYIGTATPLLNNLSGPGADVQQILRGGPSWISADRFTIETKQAGDADRETILGPMLRALLEDRFQLKIHRATETAPMYVLTVAKNGLNKDKVKPTAAGACWTSVPGTPRTPPPGLEDKPACGTVHEGIHPGDNHILEYTGASLGRTGFLSGMMDRPVLNQTGLDPNAMYSFVLEFAPDERTVGAFGRARGPAPDGPSIFKALEALGLKLELGKGPREYLVIDRIEKPKPDGLEPNPPARAQGAGRTGRPR